MPSPMPGGDSSRALRWRLQVSTSGLSRILILTADCSITHRPVLRPRAPAGEASVLLKGRDTWNVFAGGLRSTHKNSGLRNSGPNVVTGQSHPPCHPPVHYHPSQHPHHRNPSTSLQLSYGQQSRWSGRPLIRVLGNVKINKLIKWI